MRLAFTDDQIAMRAGLTDLLERECPAEVVRGAWEGKPSHLWPRLVDMGLVGLTAPEDLGGMGMGDIETACLLEEAGRFALPEPVLETTAVAIPALVEAGGPMAERWVPELARGGAIATAGAGASPLFPDAERSDLLVVVQEDHLLAVEARGCDLAPQDSVDGSRRLATATWDEGAAVSLDADPGLAFDRGAVAAAAFLVGLARHMIDVAAGHAADRRQFGRPIGSFQAVQHHLANALLRIEFARPVVHRAAYGVAQLEPERSLYVSMAKAYASDAAVFAGRTALQVHGAMGYTWEHDLHLWMKRAWVLAGAWGSARWHRNRVGDALSLR